jgi:hypothetical protein
MWDIWIVMILAGFVTSLFGLMDQDLSINPHFTENQAGAVITIGFALMTIGLIVIWQVAGVMFSTRRKTMKLTDPMTSNERLEMIGTLAAAIREMSRSSSRAVFSKQIFKFSETITFLATMPDSFIKANLAQIVCDWAEAQKIVKGI